MSWRIRAWITARRSIGSARRPATPSMAWYWRTNQPASTSGLAVASINSPTLPVTQTAAFVTHTVTPRITKSPAALATPPATAPTASQTYPGPGRSHGLGIGPSPARAGWAWIPAPRLAKASTSVASSADPATRALRKLMRELRERWNGGGEFGVSGWHTGKRRCRPGRAANGIDLPGAVLPDE